MSLPRSAFHPVGAGAAVDRVPAPGAGDEIVAAIAGQDVSPNDAGSPQSLDIGRERQGAGGPDGVGAGIRRFGHLVAGGVGMIDVVAEAADHDVGAGAAVEHVVAVAALEPVVAAEAGQPVRSGAADQSVGERCRR